MKNNKGISNEILQQIVSGKGKHLPYNEIKEIAKELIAERAYCENLQCDNVWSKGPENATVAHVQYHEENKVTGYSACFFRAKKKTLLDEISQKGEDEWLKTLQGNAIHWGDLKEIIKQACIKYAEELSK